MIIAKFKRDGDSFTGTLQTLTCGAAVAIEPIQKAKEKAPDYHLFLQSNRVEIGTACKETSEQVKSYLSVTIDHPSFPKTLRCALFEGDNGQYQLVWNR